MKAEIPYFQEKKFFTPPTSFLPPFYEFEFPSQIRFFKTKKAPKSDFFKKGGKKLVEGGKKLFF